MQSDYKHHFAWKGPCETLQKWFRYKLSRQYYKNPYPTSEPQNVIPQNQRYLQSQLNTWDSIINALSQDSFNDKHVEFAKAITAFCQKMDQYKGSDALFDENNKKDRQHDTLPKIQDMLDAYAKKNIYEPAQKPDSIIQLFKNQFVLFDDRYTEQLKFAKQLGFKDLQEMRDFKGYVKYFSEASLRWIYDRNQLRKALMKEY